MCFKFTAFPCKNIRHENLLSVYINAKNQVGSIDHSSQNPFEQTTMLPLKTNTGSKLKTPLFSERGLSS
jgi:hypothetical protein